MKPATPSAGFSKLISGMVHNGAAHIRCLVMFCAMGVFVCSAQSALILDDVWIDGTRDDEELPDESIWVAQSSSSLVAQIGSMTGFANENSSRLWMTYFTRHGAPPVEIPETERLTATLEFTPSGMNTGTNSRGVRIGLFDYSAGSRRTNDFSSSTSDISGGSVGGYMLAINFSPILTAPAIQIWARTDVGNANLIGTTAAFTSLGTGGGAADDPAFQNGVRYTLEFTVTRREGSDITVGARISNTNGWSVSHSAVDTNASPTFRFDTFAVRWERPAQTSTSVTFTRMKVEVGPPPPPPADFRITSVRAISADATEVSWAAIPGRTYAIEVSETLLPNSWVPIDSIIATGTTESYTESGLEGTSHRFYRIVESP